MTFNELTEWYLNLEKVKNLASYDIIKIKLAGHLCNVATLSRIDA